MSKAAYEGYKWLKAQLETDAEYQMLLGRLRENEPHFRAALDVLAEEERAAVIEHLGICSEMAERTTEIACFGH